jgi:hypothetical protein
MEVREQPRKVLAIYCWRSILKCLFRRPIGFSQILNFGRVIGPQGRSDSLNRTPIASQNEMLGAQIGQRLSQPVRNLNKMRSIFANLD